MVETSSSVIFRVFWLTVTNSDIGMIWLTVLQNRLDISWLPVAPIADR